MQKPRCSLVLPATIALLICSHAASANSIWISSVAIQCATVPDDTVRVDVMLENNLEPIDGGTLYVSPWDYLYPFVGAERGDLIAGWTQFNAYQQALGGGVTIEISNDTPIPPGTSGRLVRLKFLSSCCTQGGGYSSPFSTKLGIDGAGDFGPPMVSVPGTVLCAMAKPGLLAIKSGFTTCEGALVTTKVDVMLVNTTVPVDDLGFNLIWYNQSMTYLTYERGDLTADWDTFNPSPAGLGFDGSNSEPIPAGTTGTLVTLVFQADCCTNGSEIGYGAVAMQIIPQQIRGDLTSFSAEWGSWLCAPVAVRQSTWGQVEVHVPLMMALRS